MSFVFGDFKVTCTAKCLSSSDFTSPSMITRALLGRTTAHSLTATMPLRTALLNRLAFVPVHVPIATGIFSGFSGFSARATAPPRTTNSIRTYVTAREPIPVMVSSYRRTSVARYPLLGRAFGGLWFGALSDLHHLICLLELDAAQLLGAFTSEDVHQILIGIRLQLLHVRLDFLRGHLAVLEDGSRR